MSALVSARCDTVALLGCGNIGSELAAALADSGNTRLVAALVRDPRRSRHAAIEHLTSDVQEVLALRPDVVVECLGGIQPAATWCVRLLDAGISVVSANKAMVAAALPHLSAAAQRGGAQIRFDAAVCAGVPVLDAVARLASADIRGISGVVNGTTQWIIDEVSRRQCSVDDALAAALDRGFAEPDPTNDLSGRDSCEKLCLLAAAGGFGFVSADAVPTAALLTRWGRLERDDILDLQRWGALRVVARAIRPRGEHAGSEARVRLSVSPMLVAPRSALGSVQGTENVVVIDTRRAGQVSLRGPGAGAQPTVAALLADIELCATGAPSWCARSLKEARCCDDASAEVRVAARCSAEAGLDPHVLLRAGAACGVRMPTLHATRSRVLVECCGTAQAVNHLFATRQKLGDRVRVVDIEPDGVILE